MTEVVEDPRAPLDGRRLLDDARELAFPRYPGTPGDARAREIVARRFSDAGLEVAIEPFDYDIRPAFRAIRIVLWTTAALVAAAVVLGLRAPEAALALLTAGALTGGVMLVWAPGAERIYAAGGPTRAANVSGRRPAAGEARRTLIVLAHHDSKSQNLTFPWRMGLTLGAIAGCAGLGLTLGADLTGLAQPVAIGPAFGLVAVGSLLGLSTLRSGNRSPGGVDNAGSVAIVSGLARVLPSIVPDDVELIFLSPGAEEDHMIGAMRWLDRHAGTWGDRPVEALNFDGAGAPGRPVLITRYGLGRRFAPDLARTAVDLTRSLGQKPRRIWMPPAMGIDAIPFHHRGIPCLTLSSGSLGPATYAIHSPDDVADHLDPGALENLARLGAAVVRAHARR